MKYISTRDCTKHCTAAEAIRQGLSTDGGLFLPDQIPQISRDFLASLCEKDYVSRAEEILSLYLTDYLDDEIEDCVGRAYGANFENRQPAPLSKTSDGTYFLELWHGPTCAFKDMALQLLPSLMTTAIRKSGCDDTVAILVATSGDTGKAALEGFKDVRQTKIMVFYPEDGVSLMQKRQMATQQGKNVNVMGISGNFDDAQSGVKTLFSDPELRQKLAEKKVVLSSANSINWGRLLPQIVYYISAYCDLVADHEITLGDKVNFCVPTGNFGNILAAHYARRMGLPIGKLICASNENHILTDFMKTGVYDLHRDFHTTISPSMDILVSSNLERLLFELSGGDDSAVRTMMADMKAKKCFSISAEAKVKLTEGFWGGWCDDETAKRTIAHYFEEYSYLCDPHTAVAADVARQYRNETGDSTPLVIVSTASPYKFAASVLDALGEKDLPDDDFAVVDRLEQVSKVAAPAPIRALKDAEIRFRESCAPSEMGEKVLDFLTK